MSATPRSAGLLAALPALALGLAACGGSGTDTSSDVGHAPGEPAPPLHAPARIVNNRGAVSALVTVAIQGRPFAFKVDTGATRTVVDERVAREVGLANRGRPERVTSLGCSSGVQPVGIDDWRLGSARLPRSTVAASPTQFGGKRFGGVQFGGLLGNDVLSRYGSVSIDFKARSLTLGARTPRGRARAGAKVEEEGGEVRVVTTVRIHGSPANLIVDTGAPLTTLDTGIARRHRLRAVGRAIDASAVTCSARIQPIWLDDWSIGSVPLPAAIAASSDSSITERTQGAVSGLLGADVMARFGAVTIDFRDRKVVLGR